VNCGPLGQQLLSDILRTLRSHDRLFYFSSFEITFPLQHCFPFCCSGLTIFALFWLLAVSPLDDAAFDDMVGKTNPPS
jgi:hypothetical protein